MELSCEFEKVSDDGQLDRDVVAGGLRVRADRVRLVDQGLNLVAVGAGHRDLHLDRASYGQRVGRSGRDDSPGSKGSGPARGLVCGDQHRELLRFRRKAVACALRERNGQAPVGLYRKPDEGLVGSGQGAG